jgi:hypothetical protein
MEEQRGAVGAGRLLSNITSPPHLLASSPPHLLASSPSSPPHLLTSSPPHLLTSSPPQLLSSSPPHFLTSPHRRSSASSSRPSCYRAAGSYSFSPTGMCHGSHTARTLHCTRALFSHGLHSAVTHHCTAYTLLTVACSLCVLALQACAQLVRHARHHWAAARGGGDGGRCMCCADRTHAAAAASAAAAAAAATAAAAAAAASAAAASAAALMSMSLRWKLHLTDAVGPLHCRHVRPSGHCRTDTPPSSDTCRSYPSSARATSAAGRHGTAHS